MPEIIELTDSTWENEVADKAALILVTNGDGIRSDFTVSFKNAAAENNNGVIFAKINPENNPLVAERFDVNSKPVMIGWYKNEAVVRRARPWGTDVPLTLELLNERILADAPPVEETEDDLVQQEETALVDFEPVAVTDATFEKEVIEYSKQIPVLIDFWAEWCGPCRQVAPILDKLAKEFAGQIRVAKVDVDQNPGLSQIFRVQSIPTIMAFKSGQPVFSQPGAFPEPMFRDLIQQLIALEIPEQPAQPA